MDKEEIMPASILVTYTTSYGSTQEVAEAIAKTLRDNGFEVDLLHMRKVTGIEGYKAVVAGAPMYMFKWHKDMPHFLNKFREALEKLPVAVFSLGPFHDEEKEWQEVRSGLEKELAKYPWFKPVVHEVFGGKFDPATLRFPMNLVPGLKKLGATDIRNWDAIKAWAVSLIEKLQLK
jgi:menaquinone-dependent protoporphyrinogen oxidase